MIDSFTLLLQAFDSGTFATNWTAVVIAAIVGAAAIGGMFAASRFFSSRRYSETKLSPYECGIPPVPYSWSNINLRFYIFAILFLFPWAVIFLEQKALGNVVPFYAMVLFLGVLFFAIIYGWRKGVLEWQK